MAPDPSGPSTRQLTIGSKEDDYNRAAAEPLLDEVRDDVFAGLRG